MTADFSITQTLNSRFFRLKAPSQIEKTIPFIIQILKEYVINYYITTEITKKGNVHYHMHVTTTDSMSWLFPRLYADCTRKIGFSEVKSCYNITEWIKYMEKELSMTKLFLGEKVKYVFKGLAFSRIRLNYELSPRDIELREKYKNELEQWDGQ